MFLKAGYMEDWKFYGTYSGCPQGGIISPILANIYLNELDKKLTALMLKTPAKLCNDRKMNYVRYADDFLIAVNGDRQDCEWVKVKLTEFIRDTLKMEVSPEKTLITHSSEWEPLKKAHIKRHEGKGRRNRPEFSQFLRPNAGFCPVF